MLPFLVSLLLLSPKAAPPITEGPLVAVASVKSLDELHQALTYLAKPLDQPDLPKEAAALLDPFRGIDRAKPAGVYARWPSHKDYPDLQNLVFFAPLQDEKALFDSCRAQGYKVVALPDGLHRVDVALGLGVTLRLAHGRVYASLSRRALEALPAPEDVTLPFFAKAVVQARLWPARVSDSVGLALQRNFVPLAEAFLDTEEAKALGPDVLNQSREGYRVLPRAVSSFCAEFSHSDVTLTLDRTSHDLGLDLALQPRPGSNLRELADYLARARSQLASVARDSAFAVRLTVPPPLKPLAEKDLEQLQAGVAGFLPPEHREVVSKLIDVVVTTFTQDGLDCGGWWDAKGSGLAAVRVRQGRKLDQLFRDFYRALPAEDRKAVPVQFNVDRIGTARVHRLTMDPEFARLALREDLVVLADDEASKELLPKVLTAKLTPTAERGCVARLDLTAEWFLSQEAARKEFLKQVPGGQPSRIGASLRFDADTTLRLRLNLHRDMLIAFGLWGETE